MRLVLEPRLLASVREMGGKIFGCLAGGRNDIIAVISDDLPSLSIPVWPRSDISYLAQQMLVVAKQVP